MDDTKIIQLTDEFKDLILQINLKFNSKIYVNQR